jgi:hypothetical protein
MSNKIYLEYEQVSTKKANYVDDPSGSTKTKFSFEKRVISIPLLDDVLIEVQSQFSSFGEMVPQVQSVLQLATSVQSNITGQVAGSLLHLLNKFDIATWKKTDPLRFQTTLTFYAGQNGAYEDVFRPMTDITNYVMLTKTGNSYRTPGVNLKTIAKSGVSASAGARLVSVFIPGMVYVPQAFIRSARPTFSKYITTAGFPVWGKIDVQFESLIPASDLIWDNVRKYTDRYKEDSKKLFKDTEDRDDVIVPFRNTSTTDTFVGPRLP